MSTKVSQSGIVIAQIDRAVRGLGYGSVRNAERAAGKTQGWWRGRVRAGDLRLSDMLAILDYCGLDEGTFLNKSLGKEDSLGLDRPTGNPPEIVTRVQERLANGKESPRLPDDFLSFLDEERYSDRKKAGERALWAVDKIEDALLPSLLGVAGSTYRLQTQLQEAHHAIYVGLKLALERNDSLAGANLIRRMAYVVADDGDYKAALRLSRRAAALYLEGSDMPGMGTAVADQGIWLLNLGRPNAGIAAGKLALDHLSPDQCRYRCAANHGLALCYKEIGRFTKALEFIAETEELVGTLDPMTQCKLSWLKGALLARQGKLGSAEDILSMVVSKLRTLHPGECVIAACDLVKVQLGRGHSAQAYIVATSLVRLMEPLSRNRIISAAIAELLRGGREGLTRLRISRVLDHLALAQKDRKQWQGLLRG